jgi:sulfatase maturation enzyme AslB (radical SAM superfamily)
MKNYTVYFFRKPEYEELKKRFSFAGIEVIPYKYNDVYCLVYNNVYNRAEKFYKSKAELKEWMTETQSRGDITIEFSFRKEMERFVISEFNSFIENYIAEIKVPEIEKENYRRSKMTPEQFRQERSSIGNDNNTVVLTNPFYSHHKH